MMASRLIAQRRSGMVWAFIVCTFAMSGKTAARELNESLRVCKIRKAAAGVILAKGRFVARSDAAQPQFIEGRRERGAAQEFYAGRRGTVHHRIGGQPAHQGPRGPVALQD